jgi:hypothetical protein
MMLPGCGRRGQALLVALVLVGCGHHASVDNPGEHWQRVDSPNFRIITDARAIHYEFIAARLEHTQQAIKQAFFPQLQTPPLDVLFLNDGSLFMELSDNVDMQAMYVPRVGRQGVLVMRSGEGEDDESMAGMGVAAHLVRHAIPAAPPWMHLGFSSFLETAVVKPDGTAYFGRPPLGPAIEILQGRLLPLADLETATWAEMNGSQTRRHYATAWAFVHYMAVGGTQQLQQDFFAMVKQVASHEGPGVVRLPITKYEDGFKDYALKTFAGKPSVKVFVEQLGALSQPTLKVGPAPVNEVRALLRAIRATRAEN